MDALSFGLGVLAIYFLPTLIAGCRDHKNGFAIFVLNLLLGGQYSGGWPP
jgi:hypothetical protein